MSGFHSPFESARAAVHPGSAEWFKDGTEPDNLVPGWTLGQHGIDVLVLSGVASECLYLVSLARSLGCRAAAAASVGEALELCHRMNPVLTLMCVHEGLYDPGFMAMRLRGLQEASKVHRGALVLVLDGEHDGREHARTSPCVDGLMRRPITESALLTQLRRLQRM